MVCIDVLLDSGNEVSEGIARARLDEYTIDFKDMPYSAQIKQFQRNIDDIRAKLSKRIGFGVI